MKKIIVLLILFYIVSVLTRGAGINGTYLFEDFEPFLLESGVIKSLNSLP